MTPPAVQPRFPTAPDPFPEAVIRLQPRIVPVLGLALLVATCRAEDPAPAGTDWTYAVAMGDCAPWDGPATRLLFTETAWEPDSEPVAPMLTIAVYRPAADLAGQRISWPADTEVAYASWCPAADDCRNAEAGTIRFGRRAEDGSLDGFFDLTFAGGHREAGSFQARWRNRQVLCG